MMATQLTARANKSIYFSMLLLLNLGVTILRITLDLLLINYLSKYYIKNIGFNKHIVFKL
jgi:hypothetical protein